MVHKVKGESRVARGTRGQLVRPELQAEWGILERRETWVIKAQTDSLVFRDSKEHRAGRAIQDYPVQMETKVAKVHLGDKEARDQRAHLV